MSHGDLEVPVARLNPGGGIVTLEIQTGIHNYTSYAVRAWDLASGTYVRNMEWGGHHAPGDNFHPLINLGRPAPLVAKRIVVALQFVVRVPADNIQYRCDVMLIQDGNPLASDSHSVNRMSDLLFYGQVWIDCE
jgi:hypothetical protein